MKFCVLPIRCSTVMSADLMFIDLNSGSERNSVLHVKCFLL